MTPHIVNPAQPQRAAFTLVELVLVLVILSILATLAIEMIEPAVDQSRFEVSQRSLQNFSSAIYTEKTNSDGTTVVTGFFVDLGGPPVATAELDSDGREILTVRDLWQRPEGVEPYRHRHVVDDPEVIANTVDRDGEPVNGDSEIIIGSGWRGPYLQLPSGATGLTDGWGNPMVTYLMADPNEESPYSHLRGDADSEISSAGQDVYGLRSLGRDDHGDDSFTGGIYDRDLPALTHPLPLSGSMLFGPVLGTVSAEKSLDGDEDEAIADNIVVQLYYPDRATGRVRIERATISNARLDPTTDRDMFDYQFLTEDSGDGDEPPAMVLFPVGLRAIRAYLNDTNDVGDFSDGANDPSVKSVIQYRMLTADTNRIDLTLD